jgi:peptide/nickel transport system substrate-binding protein
VRSIRTSAPAVALAAARDQVWVTTGPVARHGGTLRVAGALEADASLDPASAYDLGKWGLLANVYDGLVGYRRTGGTAGNTIVPDLARSLPSITDGGRTYRFELRDGLRYSDGRRVSASDVKHTFARLARLLSPGTSYYFGIRSIVADDARGIVVLNLRRPDPELLNKLALPFGWVVPSSTPMREMRVSPPPATGPYRIASVVPGREVVLVRNPRFHTWSAAAQPPGNPDRIVVNISDEIAAISPQSIDRVDLAIGQPGSANTAQGLLARYAARMHTVPLAANVFGFLNTRVRPFDDVRVRRAVNYAVDRQAIARTTGAPLLAQLTCQTLPAGLLGYRPYCPYTRGRADAGVWTGPDLTKARRLITAAGRRGERVTVWAFPDFAAGARELARSMRRVGLRARVKVLPAEKFFRMAADTRSGVQASLIIWLADSQTPYGFLSGPFDCEALQPANPANTNYSQFCDARSQRAMDRALAAQATDLGYAGRLWALADRAITDAAPVVPLATLRMLTVVSKRVSGYQYHPVLGPLIDQLSVR